MKNFLNSTANATLEQIGFDALEASIAKNGAIVSIRHNKAGDLVGFRVTQNRVRVHSVRTLPVDRLSDVALRLEGQRALIAKLA